MVDAKATCHPVTKTVGVRIVKHSPDHGDWDSIYKVVNARVGSMFNVSVKKIENEFCSACGKLWVLKNTFYPNDKFKVDRHCNWCGAEAAKPPINQADS